MSSYDAVVVGAGQAGLAAARCLKQRGARAVVLEAGEQVGDSWRRRWDSLRLFTPAGFSHLPGSRLRTADPAAPAKDEVADHLAEFATRQRLDVRLGTRVDGAHRSGADLVVTTATSRWRTAVLVVATGAHRVPWRPPAAADLEVAQLDAADYRRPGDLPVGDVLVVGAANSGAEIALDLATAGRRVTLAGRDVGHLPRLGSWTFHSMRSLGTPGAWLSQRGLGGRGDPLGRLRPGDLERAGVERVPRVSGAAGGRVALADGRSVSPSVVVWATGHHPGLDWLTGLGVLDAHGRPQHRRGLARCEPALGFVGLPYQRSVTSHLLGGVGDDAAYVVDRLLRRTGRPTTRA